MNAQEVVTRARSEGVELIRFMYSDFSGAQRGKITSIDDLPNRMVSGINMTNAQMSFTIANTIAEIPGYEAVGELRMIPDPETFTVLPWMPTHASMNCDLVQKSGKPYDACPRTWLKGILDRVRTEHGIRVQAAFEDEFFLTKQNPLTGAWEMADDSGIYAETGFDYQGEYHTAMTRTLRAMGMFPEMVYHEGGPGQQEISIRHEEALRCADNQMKVRNAARGTALKFGYRASFAPKPFPDSFGNGAHVHLSIWDEKTNKNLMYDPNAEEAFSQQGRFFVGGILKHLRSLVALTCPSFNSYRRLQPRAWATAYGAWGYDNRQAAVRAASPFWGRESATSNIEIKASDNSSNPYLSLGAMIAAGIDGLENEIDPGEPLPVDPADLTQEERDKRGISVVPATLREAVAEFSEDPLWKRIMPDLMWRGYRGVKLAEADVFEANDEAFEMAVHMHAF